MPAFPATSLVGQAYKSLRGFERIALNPGATRRVTIKLVPRSFEYWSTAENAWVANYGPRTVWVGGSSADLPLSASTAPLTATSTEGGVGGTVPLMLSLTLNTAPTSPHSWRASRATTSPRRRRR